LDTENSPTIVARERGFPPGETRGRHALKAEPARRFGPLASFRRRGTRRPSRRAERERSALLASPPPDIASLRSRPLDLPPAATRHRRVVTQPADRPSLPTAPAGVTRPSLTGHFPASSVEPPLRRRLPEPWDRLRSGVGAREVFVAEHAHRVVRLEVGLRHRDVQVRLRSLLVDERAVLHAELRAAEEQRRFRPARVRAVGHFGDVRNARVIENAATERILR